MKKRQFQLKNYVIATSVFILAVVVGIFIFFTCVQRSVSENSRSIMITNVSRQSEHLRTILNIHYQYLNEIAAEVGKTEKIFSDENKERLVLMQENTDLERAALIDTDGNAYYDNGVVKNVAHRRYFKEAMNGQETLSDPLESSVDHEVRVVLGVPVYRDEEVIGVVGGSYNVTTLSHMLFDDLFGGQGNSFIVTSDGLIIAFDSGSSSSTEITYGTNLFEYYSQKNLKEGHILQDIQDDFQQGNRGLIKLSLKERNEEDRYLAYVPLGLNDWMIGYSVPIRAAQEDYAFIQNYELIFMGMFCVLVLLLVLYILIRNNKEKAAILQTAQTDALTGALNKETTQKKIDEILSEKDSAALHGFIIMDMDHFKSVNDTYGHAVGDKVLQVYGSILKEEFREQDVVGRIGGDEFVVLLRNIGSRNVMEQRVKDLQDKIRTMHVEELGDWKFTLSAGVAFAPVDGTSFMELYCRADSALYQAKRAGRDGYRVYDKSCG